MWHVKKSQKIDKTEWVEEYDPKNLVICVGHREYKFKFSALLDTPSSQQNAFNG